MEYHTLLLNSSWHQCNPHTAREFCSLLLVTSVLAHKMEGLLCQRCCRNHPELFVAASGLCPDFPHSCNSSQDSEQELCSWKTRGISWVTPLHCHSECIITTICHQWITMGLRTTQHLECQVGLVGCRYHWCTDKMTTQEKWQKGCVGKPWSQCAWLPASPSLGQDTSSSQHPGCGPGLHLCLHPHTSTHRLSQQPMRHSSSWGNPASRNLTQKPDSYPKQGSGISFITAMVWQRGVRLNPGLPELPGRQSPGATAHPCLHSHRLGAVVCWTPAPGDKGSFSINLLGVEQEASESERPRQMPHLNGALPFLSAKGKEKRASLSVTTFLWLLPKILLLR